MKQKSNWILCTKWYDKVKEGKKTKLIPYWMPIGINAKIPLWWSSLEEAKKALVEIGEARPDVLNLLTVACEVKYVPSEIKKYKETWFDKYVKQEVKLKLEKTKDEGEACFHDDISIDINQ